MTPGPETETFGQRVRRLRRERGLSQRALASRVRIDNTYLSKLENDRPGQSPGGDLVKRLARALGQDQGELLALAGHVPIQDLRTRAREDTDFARSLRRLPGIRDAKIAELVTPPEEMAAIDDTDIVARFALGEVEGERLVTCSYESSFQTGQDEYLIGLVAERAHRDRLRKDEVPLHDILVYWQAGGDADPEQIGRELKISVGYQEASAGAYGAYQDVPLERVEDVTALWSPEAAEDRFPLTVLRAILPRGKARRPGRMALGYRYTLPAGHFVWFWRASRPTFVNTITVDARALARQYDCVFENFLPGTYPTPEGPPGLWTLQVSNWAVEGHGVNLSWSPLRRRGRSPPRA